jgi:prepilin-type N-terminal cleavage/methylation domain-containing protein
MKRTGFSSVDARFGGFTLVEMVLTLAIFLLLAGAVFGIMTGILKASSALQDNQNRRDEVMALQEFLRHDLDGLPGWGQLNSYQRGDGEGLPVNGIIFGTPGLYTAIDAKRQANGLYTLRVARFSASEENNQAVTLFTQAVTGDDDSLAWRNLMRDVKRIDWKFLPENSTQWTDNWPLSSTLKPNLIQLTLLPAGDTQPTVTDVWLPPIAPQIIITANGVPTVVH